MHDEARRLVTFLDIAYESNVQLVTASSVPPQEMFQPLLQAAYEQGLNPNLGLAKSARKELGAFQQQAASGSGSVGIPAGKGDGASAAKESGAVVQGSQGAFEQPKPAQSLPQPPEGYHPAVRGPGESEVALSPETVLMLHRATSRMTEMMRAVPVA